MAITIKSDGSVEQPATQPIDRMGCTWITRKRERIHIAQRKTL